MVKSFEILEFVNTTEETNITNNDMAVFFCIITLVEIPGEIMKTLKENENEYTWGNVTVKLAESYGFCWGVERAVQIAYEARKQFPEENIWITHEIFHNPSVNKVYIFLPKFHSNNCV